MPKVVYKKKKKKSHFHLETDISTQTKFIFYFQPYKHTPNTQAYNNRKIQNNFPFTDEKLINKNSEK